MNKKYILKTATLLLGSSVLLGTVVSSVLLSNNTTQVIANNQSMQRSILRGTATAGTEDERFNIHLATSFPTSTSVASQITISDLVLTTKVAGTDVIQNSDTVIQITDYNDEYAQISLSISSIYNAQGTTGVSETKESVYQFDLSRNYKTGIKEGSLTPDALKILLPSDVAISLNNAAKLADSTAQSKVFDKYFSFISTSMGSGKTSITPKSFVSNDLTGTIVMIYDASANIWAPGGVLGTPQSLTNCHFIIDGFTNLTKSTNFQQKSTTSALLDFYPQQLLQPINSSSNVLLTTAAPIIFNYTVLAKYIEDKHDTTITPSSLNIILSTDTLNTEYDNKLGTITLHVELVSPTINGNSVISNIKRTIKLTGFKKATGVSSLNFNPEVSANNTTDLSLLPNVSSIKPSGITSPVADKIISSKIKINNAIKDNGNDKGETTAFDIYYQTATPPSSPPVTLWDFSNDELGEFSTFFHLYNSFDNIINNDGISEIIWQGGSKSIVAGEFPTSLKDIYTFSGFKKNPSTTTSIVSSSLKGDPTKLPSEISLAAIQASMKLGEDSLPALDAANYVIHGSSASTSPAIDSYSITNKEGTKQLDQSSIIITNVVPSIISGQLMIQYINVTIDNTNASNYTPGTLTINGYQSIKTTQFNLPHIQAGILTPSYYLTNVADITAANYQASQTLELASIQLSSYLNKYVNKNTLNKNALIEVKVTEIMIDVINPNQIIFKFTFINDIYINGILQSIAGYSFSLDLLGFKTANINESYLIPKANFDISAKFAQDSTIQTILSEVTLISNNNSNIINPETLVLTPNNLNGTLKVDFQILTSIGGVEQITTIITGFKKTIPSVISVTTTELALKEASKSKNTANIVASDLSGVIYGNSGLLNITNITTENPVSITINQAKANSNANSINIEVSIVNGVDKLGVIYPNYVTSYNLKTDSNFADNGTNIVDTTYSINVNRGKDFLLTNLLNSNLTNIDELITIKNGAINCDNVAPTNPVVSETMLNITQANDIYLNEATGSLNISFKPTNVYVTGTTQPISAPNKVKSISKIGLYNTNSLGEDLPLSSTALKVDENQLSGINLATIYNTAKIDSINTTPALINAAATTALIAKINSANSTTSLISGLYKLKNSTGVVLTGSDQTKPTITFDWAKAGFTTTPITKAAQAKHPEISMTAKMSNHILNGKLVSAEKIITKVIYGFADTGVETKNIFKLNTPDALMQKYGFEITDQDIINNFSVSADKIPAGIPQTVSGLLTQGYVSVSFGSQPGEFNTGSIIFKFTSKFGRSYDSSLLENLVTVKPANQVVAGATKKVIGFLNETSAGLDTTNLVNTTTNARPGIINNNALSTANILNINNRNVLNYLDFSSLGKVDTTNVNATVVPGSIDLGVDGKKPKLEINISVKNILTKTRISSLVKVVQNTYTLKSFDFNLIIEQGVGGVNFDLSKFNSNSITTTSNQGLIKVDGMAASIEINNPNWWNKNINDQSADTIMNLLQENYSANLNKTVLANYFTNISDFAISGNSITFISTYKENATGFNFTDENYKKLTNNTQVKFTLDGFSVTTSLPTWAIAVISVTFITLVVLATLIIVSQIKIRKNKDTKLIEAKKGPKDEITKL